MESECLCFACLTRSAARNTQVLVGAIAGGVGGFLFLLLVGGVFLVKLRMRHGGGRVEVEVERMKAQLSRKIGRVATAEA